MYSISCYTATWWDPRTRYTWWDKFEGHRSDSRAHPLHSSKWSVQFTLGTTCQPLCSPWWCSACSLSSWWTISRQFIPPRQALGWSTSLQCGVPVIRHPGCHFALRARPLPNRSPPHRTRSNYFPHCPSWMIFRECCHLGPNPLRVNFYLTCFLFLPSFFKLVWSQFWIFQTFSRAMEQPYFHWCFLID